MMIYEDTQDEYETQIVGDEITKHHSHEFFFSLRVSSFRVALVSFVSL